MKKILIFGVNGYTGQKLVELLGNEKNHLIYGADIQYTSVNNEVLFSYHKVDITSFKEVYEILNYIRPDQIYNLSGLMFGDNVDILNVNFKGVINIIESVLQTKNDNSNILFIGSSAEYGCQKNQMKKINEDASCNPINIYGISKYCSTLAINHYVNKFNLKATIVRPFNIIGENTPKSLFVGSIISQIIDNIKLKIDSPVYVGNINTFRDFIDINDVVKAYKSIMDSGLWGQTFNICSENAIKIEKILDIILSFPKEKICYKINPDFVRKDDIIKVIGSNEKIRKIIGFENEVPLYDSLLSTWNYYLNK